MSNAVLTKLADERDRLIGFIDETLSRASEDERDLTETEVRNLASTKERISAIDAQMGPLNDFEQIRSAGVEIDRRVTTNPRPGKTEQIRAQVNESLGSLFVASDQYRSYNGGTSGRFDIPDLSMSQLRQTLAIGSTPGSLLLPRPQRVAVEGPQYPTPLLDAVQRVTVSTNSLELVRFDDPYGAGIVAEGDLKPDITVGLTIDVVNLVTIAGVLYSTRQFMQDVAAAESYISQNLTRAVLKEFEALILATLQAAVVYQLPLQTGEELLAWIRRASATIQSRGYVATQIWLHPDAAAQLDLQLLSLGGSSTANVIARAGGSIWGLEIVPIASLAPDEIYVLDSSAAITAYERSGISVHMTDSDILGEGASAQSAFRRNTLVTLAEGRGAAHVGVPAAVVKAGAPGTAPTGPTVFSEGAYGIDKNGNRVNTPSGPASPRKTAQG